jgi:hypothetical protein
MARFAWARINLERILRLVARDLLLSSTVSVHYLRIVLMSAPAPEEKRKRQPHRWPWQPKPRFPNTFILLADNQLYADGAMKLPAVVPIDRNNPSNKDAETLFLMSLFGFFASFLLWCLLPSLWTSGDGQNAWLLFDGQSTTAQLSEQISYRFAIYNFTVNGRTYQVTARVPRGEIAVQRQVWFDPNTPQRNIMHDAALSTVGISLALGIWPFLLLVVAAWRLNDKAIIRMSAPKQRDGQPVQGYIMDAYHQTLLGQIEVNFDDCFTSPHTGELLYGKTNHKGYTGN